jgi:hypothetical protein
MKILFTARLVMGMRIILLGLVVSLVMMPTPSVAASRSLSTYSGSNGYAEADVTVNFDANGATYSGSLRDKCPGDGASAVLFIYFVDSNWDSEDGVRRITDDNGCGNGSISFSGSFGMPHGAKARYVELELCELDQSNGTRGPCVSQKIYA